MSDGGGDIQTVTGRVAADSIGFTLPHEHTAIALWHVRDRWDYWELTPDESIVVPELEAFRVLGGSCLADLTLPGVGRDPAWLVRLSKRVGIPVVMGAGWYRESYYPAEARIDRRSVEDLADELVREFHEGVPGTDVRPGVLGEIGTDKPWVTAQEERVFRAVARASRATGMGIVTHAVLSDVGLAQLRILEDAGADPGRVVIGHADSYPSLEHYLRLIERGASIEFDFLGMSFTVMEQHGEARVIRLLLELLERGHEDRVCLSQDVCHNSQLRPYGGNGYVYLQETFLPRLRDAGVPDTTIDRLTIENPRRLLTLATPG